MASYNQISKGNWQVVISLGNDPVTKKRIRVKKQGFKTKKEAEKFVNEYSSKVDNGFLLPKSKDIYLKDFILDWFYNHKVLSIGINTRNNYLSRIETYIVPLLGNYKLTELDTLTIQNFYNHLLTKDNPLKPSSAKKVIEALSNCLKYAKKLKLITYLPTDIEKVNIEKPKIEFWSKQQLDFFLNEIKDTYLYFPVLICALTGVRVGELCGLKWCDVDFRRGYLNINRQVISDKSTNTLVCTENLKTTNSDRTISIPKILLKEFEKNLKDPNDFIVLSRENEMCNPRNISMDFTKKVNKYKDRLPQISIHGLRHTHATLLILNGENIKIVSDRLGHNDITTTLNTYTHIMEEMKDNTAELLDNLFINNA
ncbi:tyrosine-type recombinase/integrase [Clostridium perfringens]